MTIRQMDDGALRWLKKHARNNHWRIAAWYDLDDLIQDGVMCYYRVLSNYPSVTERRHVMRLFQVTFSNHIHDLSKNRSRERDTLADVTAYFTDVTVEHPIDFSVGVLTPEERAFLKLFTTEAGLRKLRAPYRRRKDNTRETFKERLQRLIGPHDVDVLDDLRKHLLSTR